jgi:hypothetical protein
MKPTRKQKVRQQRDFAAQRAAERAMGPIRDAIESGELTIAPVRVSEPDPLSGREYCPRCASGPRQPADVDECPDCGYRWSGPPLSSFR